MKKKKKINWRRFKKMYRRLGEYKITTNPLGEVYLLKKCWSDDWSEVTVYKENHAIKPKTVLYTKTELIALYKQTILDERYREAVYERTLQKRRQGTRVVYTHP